MKKLYSAPLMEIEKFDVKDIITTSVIDTASHVIDGATDGTFEVEIVSKW